MTLADFFTAINAAGIRLAAAGEHLELRGSPDAVTPDIRAGAAEHKAELLALLTSSPKEMSLETVERSQATYLPCVCPTGRCWRCCNRPCERCGKPTGSAFIRTCIACGFLPDPE
jgi:hypothetical protein